MRELKSEQTQLSEHSPDDLCPFEPAGSSKRLTTRVPFAHGFSLPIDPFGSGAPLDQRNIHHSDISLVHLVSAVPANKVNKVNPAGPTAAKPPNSSLRSSSSPSPHRNDINPRRTPAPKGHRFQGAGQKDATLQTLKPRTPSPTSPASTRFPRTTAPNPHQRENSPAFVQLGIPSHDNPLSADSQAAHAASQWPGTESSVLGPMPAGPSRPHRKKPWSQYKSSDVAFEDPIPRRISSESHASSQSASQACLDHHVLKMALTKLFSTGLLLASLASAKWIVPGGRWRDTEGNLVNAHAGGVTIDRDTGKFFWFGEYKVQGQEEGGGVSVYSSDDLATWEFHGKALEPIDGHPYIDSDMIIQRPKVVYSEPTGEYHMWWHADNSTYGLLLQGLATSPNISGPYTFVDATAPLGNWSQDFGIFTDYKDGRSYALYSNGDRREGRDVYLSSFNDELTNVTDVVHRFDKYDLEAPTIIQTDSSYYALMSHKTGYRPNNVVAFRADSLAGPWSQPFFVSDSYTRTYNSQSGFSLRINGSEVTTYLYLGDQWDSNSLWESRYIWLPLSVDDEKKSVHVEWHDIYDLDVKTGVVTPIEGTTYTAHDSATVSGNAFKQEANFASGGTIVTGIYGNDSKVTFEGIEGAGEPQWVSFYYQNTDDMGFGDQPGGTPDRIGGSWQLRRIASVIVNGNEQQVESLYQRDTHKGIILSTPLNLTLDKGSNNTISIGGLWNGFDFKGADIDRIVVYSPEKK